MQSILSLPFALIAFAAFGLAPGETAFAGPAPAAQSARAAGGIAARVGATEITLAEVDALGEPRRIQIDAAYEAQLRTLNVQRDKARAALLERSVDQLVTDRLLELEATATGSSPGQLLAALQPAPVTDADIAAFHAENSARITRPLAEVSGQIRELLSERAATRARSEYLASLRARHGVRMLYEPQRFDVSGGRHFRGPQAAPVTIVEFADFQCPYCARLVPLMDRLLETYPTQVRHVYRHFPLTTLHPLAVGAAVAAECAAEQQKFWPMHDAILKNQSKLAREALVVAAAQLGLDAAKFTACLDSPAAKAAVERDLARGRELPVEGTPTLFINGRPYLGNVNFDTLVKYVEDELSRTAPQSASAVLAP